MAQSSELAGGEGFTYEGDAAAFYLSALLAEGYAPGIPDRVVHRVAVQQRDFGEPLDDVIVDFRDAQGDLARLSLQVKRSLTISDAASNSDFRDILRDSWATLGKADFREGVDRFGVAVGTVAAAKSRALTTLCDLARESTSAAEFDARFAPTGNAGPPVVAVKDDVVVILNEQQGRTCTSGEVHRFLAHFVLIEFDFLHDGAVDPPAAISRLADCLAASEAAKAPLLWARLVQLARGAAGKSGVFNRSRLVGLASPSVRLRVAASLRSDIEILTQLGRTFLAGIQDDVGNTRLVRADLAGELAGTSRISLTRVTIEIGAKSFSLS